MRLWLIFRRQLRSLPFLRRLVIDASPFFTTTTLEQVITAEAIEEYLAPVVRALPVESALEAFVVHTRFRDGAPAKYATLEEGKLRTGPQWAEEHGVPCGTFRTGLMKENGAWVIHAGQLCTGEDVLTRASHVRPGYLFT